MARGYRYASGASAEVSCAREERLATADLIDLGQSKNAYVREIIGGRSDCPMGMLVVFAHDRVADVRCAVAANPVAPLAVLEMLAQDRAVSVLTALASNPALPEHLVANLAAHRRADVRALVAHRASIPAATTRHTTTGAVSWR